VPSVRRYRQSGRSLAVLALGGTLAVAGLTGCETTQEKAAAHRAESERILQAREQRQQAKKQLHRQGKHEEKEKG
jgi:hypothetical protein